MATRREPTAANAGGEDYRSNVLYNVATSEAEFEEEHRLGVI
jgi:hypothetical protein